MNKISVDRWVPIIAVSLFLLPVTPSAAQDLGSFAGIAAGAGEGLGQAAGGTGPSVFVSATGHARLSATQGDTYFVNVEGKAQTAVDAVQARDRKVAAARAVAAQFDVQVQLGSSVIASDVDYGAPPRHVPSIGVDHSATPPPLYIAPVVAAPAPPPSRIFVARTAIQFRGRDSRRIPGLMDALKAAGIDEVAAMMNQQPIMAMAAFQGLGFGNETVVDDSV